MYVCAPMSAQKPHPLSAQYRIGIDAMDAQHERLFHLIDKFRETSASHLLDSVGIAAARDALEQLLEYTRLHFASEEKLLAERRYPGLDAHRALHRQIEAEVIALLTEIREHKTRTTPLKLNLFATIWLMEHIAGDDRDYARYVLAQS
jgi:hemerythrin